jgi:hypothetical protein
VLLTASTFSSTASASSDNKVSCGIGYTQIDIATGKKKANVAVSEGRAPNMMFHNSLRAGSSFIELTCKDGAKRLIKQINKDIKKKSDYTVTDFDALQCRVFGKNLKGIKEWSQKEDCKSKYTKKIVKSIKYNQKIVKALHEKMTESQD